MPKAEKGWSPKFRIVSDQDQRFSKLNKLVKPTDFRKVFKSTKKLADPGFVILFSQNDLEVARLGTVISKKNIRLATTRNRLKRLVRESFRRSKNCMKGLDIVVIVKKNINIKNNSMIAASLAKQWQKISRA